MVKACSFIGDNTIDITKELVQKLYDVISELIVYKGVRIFFFGDNSKFDILCYGIVTDFKRRYTQIHRIYISGEEISDEHTKKYLESSYERYYCSHRISTRLSCTRVDRYEELIGKSDFVITYLDDENINTNIALAYRYALSRQKCVFNLCENIIL